MATAQVSTDPSRMSFAKVAASAGKDNVALSSFAKAPSSAPTRDSRKENIPVQALSMEGGIHIPDVSSSPARISNDVQMAQSTESIKPETLAQQPKVVNGEAKLIAAVEALSVNEPMPSLVVNGSGIPSSKIKVETVDGFVEDPFQRTDSGSELGTKPPSLDGKSITSGTTFALDEKESLRPDDSASVKAAEDDDTFSGRGSIVAGSRIGSEAAGRSNYRAQFYEPLERRQGPQIQGQEGQGIVTPQSGSSGQQTTDDGKPKPVTSGAEAGAFDLFYRHTPDEKLLEALESPKDRMFLLRLEQDLIEFVRSSKEPFIDLPPCNSFCRMLAHKLADYYHMTHQVDSSVGAVRIFRTPFVRIPPLLATISNPPTTGNTPPPTMPAMKIMRRGGEGDTGPSPSKSASETGSDGKDKSLSAKEKLSREEREAAYFKARERIFGKESEKSGDATPEIEDVNEMSRSSSVSTKDRAAQTNRPKPPKKRRDDSESFDSRSAYAPYFPPTTGPTWVPAASGYPPMAPQQFNGPVQPAFQGPMPQSYAAPPQPYNQPMMNNNVQMFNPVQQQYPPQNQPRFQNPHSAPISAYGSPVQSPPLPSQQWPQQPAYQGQYQQQGPMVRGAPSTIPYPFGQLPSMANPADPKSQHPIPGSFNRHAFNPKTQSFVPGNGGMQIPQPMSHHGSPHHGSPHHGSPHLPYNAFNPPQQQFAGNMGYNMARQGSNNSVPSYHASPMMAHRPMMHQGMPQGPPQGMPQGLLQGMPQGLPQGMPHGMASGLPQNIPHGMQMQQNGQMGTHLPNYGNPSTLPPKPPTGI